MASNTVNLSTYKAKILSNTYGANNKPIYFNDGVPTILTTIGKTSLPVWVDNGVIKTITSYEGNADTATTASYLSTPSDYGYSTDDYGNFICKNTTDSVCYWHLDNNGKTVSSRYYWDTGDLYLYGKLGIGYNPTTSGNTYSLYVNGTSYFNGNTTHNGIDYFANGTTYYINNSGTANLYGLTTNATATIKSTLRINNAKNDTIIYYRYNNNTKDSGYFGPARSNPGDGDLYYDTRFRILQYSYNSSSKARLDTYEYFDFPTVTADRTSSAGYSVRTSKSSAYNVDTASKWQTARTLTVGATGKSVDGSGNVSWSMNEIMGSSDSTKFYRGDKTWASRLTGGLDAAYIGVTNTTSTNGYGISLYNGATAGAPTYGIMFQGTGTFGKHGSVSSDWATYFTMNDNTARGWIFRCGTTNVASISGGGNLALSGDGIYYVGSKSTNRMIRFLNNTSDAYGNGISIGGGGLTIIGAGESADTIINNVNGTAGSETMYIGSDGNICFYPNNNSYDASALITMTASRLWVGVNGNTKRENQIGIQGGAGQMYLWCAASTTGDRGIWLPAHGSGSACSVFSVDQNNYRNIYGNNTWGGAVRMVDNWVGFYSSAFGGTRYGYIQANADRMYYRKENGVSTYHHDFNGHVYAGSNLYAGGSVLANNGYLYSTANSVTVQIGGQNSGCCHIYISQNVPFAFNRGFLMVNSGDIGSASYPTGNIVVKASGRISGNGGALYIGNSGNQSWVYTQDIASQSGTDKWAIHQTNGNAEFYGTLTAGVVKTVSNSLPILRGTRTDAGEVSIYLENNTAGWAMGINAWGVGAGQFAIGQYSGTGSSAWRLKIDNNGYVYTSSYLNLGAGNEKNAASPPYVLGFNSSDTYIRSYQTAYLSVASANTMPINTSSGSGYGIGINARQMGPIVVVNIQGTTTSAIAAGTVLRTLPEGYRPLQAQWYNGSNGSGAVIRFGFYSNGQITTQGSIANGTNVYCVAVFAR